METDAQTAEIKSAFRKLALKLHPDVSDAPDANERFAALSEAYGRFRACCFFYVVSRECAPEPADKTTTIISCPAFNY